MLIAARQLSNRLTQRRQPDAEFFHRFRRRRLFLPAPDYAHAGQLAQRRGGNVLFHRQRAEYPRHGPILGDKGQPKVNRLRWVGNADFCAMHSYRARPGRGHAEQGACHIGAPGTDQPAKANDLALAHRETDVVKHAGQGQVFDAQRHIADLRALFVQIFLERPANHMPDNIGVGQVADGIGDHL